MNNKDKFSKINEKIAKIKKDTDVMKEILRLCRIERENKSKKSDKTKMEKLMKELK